MLGNAGAGKTPAAQAIAMAFSEYWILRAGHERELRPSFRLSNSLENLRGEPGLRERPDILDDSDMSSIPLPKVKAFLDSSLSETFTVERWKKPRMNTSMKPWKKPRMTHLSNTHQGHPSLINPLHRLLHLPQSASSANHEPPSEKYIIDWVS